MIDDITTFASKIKAKFPEYGDIDDADLVDRIVRKYPVYAGQVDLPSDFKLLKTTSGYPKIDAIYEQAGREHNVDPNLLLEQGRQETINFKPEVMYGQLNSPKGARGAGQFMPGTAPTYGLVVNDQQDDRTDPVKSIGAQAKYMRKLLDQFDGDESLALAGYNAGEGAVTKYKNKVPPYSETRKYVDTISGKLNDARSRTTGNLRDFLPKSPEPTVATQQTLPGTVRPDELSTANKPFLAPGLPIVSDAPISPVTLLSTVQREQPIEGQTDDPQLLPPSHLANKIPTSAIDGRATLPLLRNDFDLDAQLPIESPAGTVSTDNSLLRNDGAPFTLLEDRGKLALVQDEKGKVTLQSKRKFTSVPQTPIADVPAAQRETNWKTAGQPLNDEQLMDTSITYPMDLTNVKGDKTAFAIQSVRNGLIRDFGLTPQQARSVVGDELEGGAFDKNAGEVALHVKRGDIAKIVGADKVKADYDAERGDSTLSLYQQTQNANSSRLAEIPNFGDVPRGLPQTDPLTDEARANIFATPFSEGTEADVQKEVERLKKWGLTPEDYQEIADVQRGGVEKFGSVGGAASSGLLGAGGRLLQSVAGVLRLANSAADRTALQDVINDYLAEPLAKQGLKQTLVEQWDAKKNPGILNTALRIGTGLTGDTLRFVMLSKLPGGAPVMFGTDAALQSIGSGDRPESVVGKTTKGIALGSIFKAASKVADAVENNTLRTFVNPAFDVGKTPTPIEQLAAKVFGVGAKIGTIGAGTGFLERATGATNEDALHAGITMALTSLILDHSGGMAAGIKGLAGKVFRARKGDTIIDGTIGPDGAVNTLKNPVPDQFVDIDMVFDPATGEYHANVGKQSSKSAQDAADATAERDYQRQKQARQDSYRMDAEIYRRQQQDRADDQAAIDARSLNPGEPRSLRSAPQGNPIQNPGPGDNPIPARESGLEAFRVENADPQAIQKATADKNTRKIIDVLKGKDFQTVDDVASAARINKTSVEDGIMTLVNARMIEILPDNRVRLIDEGDAQKQTSLYQRATQLGKQPDVSTPPNTLVGKTPGGTRTAQPPNASNESVSITDPNWQPSGKTTEISKPEYIEPPTTTMEQARSEGTYNRDGIQYQRQEPIEDAPTGKSGKVRFADAEPDPLFKYRLIEADKLQPADLGGNENRNHFLPEAQPKDRSTEASKMASDRIAENPDLEQVAESPNAYSGAPVVNARGEVIQGNNRSEGLRKHYDRYAGDDRRYKKDLAENAERFGFDRAQVESMDKPVLVRQIDADDETAVRLGQYTFNDLESGGSQRINPINTAARIPHEKKFAMLDDIFRNAKDDSTLKTLIRENKDKVKVWLNDYLTDTQKETLENPDKQFSPDAVKDIVGVFTHFIFDKGDEHLPDYFDGLSHTAKEGIIGSLPRIFSTKQKDSLIPEIQNAILAANSFRNSGINEIDIWKRQPDMLEHNRAPIEMYTPVELDLAERFLNAKSQKQVRDIFTHYAKVVNGTPGDLFDDPRPPRSKADAIKEVFGVEYVQRAAAKPAQAKSAAKDTDRQDQGIGETPDRGTGDNSVSGGETLRTGPKHQSEEQGSETVKKPTRFATTIPDAEPGEPRDVKPIPLGVKRAMILYEMSKPGADPELLARAYGVDIEQVKALRDLGPVGKHGQISHIIYAGLANDPPLLNKVAKYILPEARVNENNPLFGVQDASRAILLKSAEMTGYGRSSEMGKKGWNEFLDTHADKLPKEFVQLIHDAVAHHEEWYRKRQAFINDPENVEFREGLINDARQTGGIEQLLDKPWIEYSLRDRKEILRIGRKYEIESDKEGNRFTGLSDAVIKEAFLEAVGSTVRQELAKSTGDAGDRSESRSVDTASETEPFEGVESDDFDVPEDELYNVGQMLKQRRPTDAERHAALREALEGGKPTIHVLPSGKAFVVKNSIGIKKELQEIGGRYHSKEQGWMFPIARRAAVEAVLEELRGNAPGRQTVQREPNASSSQSDYLEENPVTLNHAELLDVAEEIDIDTSRVKANIDRYGLNASKVDESHPFESIIDQALNEAITDAYNNLGKPKDAETPVKPNSDTVSELKAEDQVATVATLHSPKVSDNEIAAANEIIQPISDFGAKIGGARKDTAESGFTKRVSVAKSDTPIWMKGFSIGELPDGTFRSILATEGRGHRRVIWESKEDYSTREEALDAIKAAYVAMKFRVRKGENNFEIYRKVSDKKFHTIKDEFETREAAMDYLARNLDYFANYKPQFPERPHIEDIQRTGKQYRKGNVTTKQFLDRFGFTGGEFGNWIPQDERQRILNMAYDGLSDLADVLEVPPKALSLGGQLSIAFGSRGHGLTGAAAHYERNRAVFNLTRLNGAGSVAHEWFHALDHYFGAQDKKSTLEKDDEGKVKSVKGRDQDYLSHGHRFETGVRPVVLQAFLDLIKTIYRQPKIVEVSIDRYEKQLERAHQERERQIKQLRDYVAKEYKYSRKSAPATTEQLKLFDDLVDRIRKNDLGEPVTIETKAQHAFGMNTFQAFKNLNDLVTQIRGRSEYKVRNERSDGGMVRKIANYTKSIADSEKQLEHYRKDNHEEKLTPTKYAYNARDIDKLRSTDYWSTEHEMAARAFESYVQDQLADRGDKSEYLVHSTDNSLYKLLGLSPYPEGIERVRINDAFKKFFDVVETKEDEKGNVLMFNHPHIQFTNGDELQLDRRGKLENEQLAKHQMAAIRNFPATVKKMRFSVGDDGVLEAKNVEALTVMATAIGSFTGFENSLFHGFYSNPKGAQQAVEAFKEFAEAFPEAQRQFDAAINALETAIDDTHGDLTFTVDFPRYPTLSRITRQEELSHRANTRSGATAVFVDIADVPSIKKGIANLSHGYSKLDVQGKVDEVIAKSFRDDAETELGLSKKEARANRKALFTGMKTAGIEPVEFGKNIKNVSRKGAAFARYAESTNRFERSTFSNESAGTREIPPALRDILSARRQGSRNSRGFAGTDADRFPRLRQTEVFEPSGSSTLDKLSQSDQKWIEKHSDLDFALEKSLATDVLFARQPRSWGTVSINGKNFNLGKAATQTKDLLIDILQTPKAIKASVDLSSLRQGMITSVNHPVIASKAFVKQLPMTLPGYGANKFKTFKRDLDLHPFIELAEESGLHLTSLGDGHITNREEAFMSRLLGEDPYFKNKGVEGARKFVTYPVRASERAYLTFLDTLRLEAFAKLSKELHRYNVAQDYEDDPAQYEALAGWINRSSGRGDLGRLDDAAPILNALFFSARYWASRLQVLNPAYFAKLPPGARKIAIREMLVFVGAFMMVMALLKAAGAKIEFDDPNDPNTLKITIGQYSYDLSAGMLKHLRYIYRMITATQAKAPTKDMTYLTERYVRSHAAPVPAAVWNSLEGQNYIGEPTDWKQETSDLFIPIMADSMKDAVKAEGLFGAVRMSPEFFGINTTRYSTLPELERKRDEEINRFENLPEGPEQNEAKRKALIWQELLKKTAKYRPELTQQ